MRRLLIRPGAIGDCILSLPALESLRQDYTEIWVAAPNVPLVRFADRVQAISATGLDLLGLPDVDPPPSLLAALRSFHSIVSWYGANRPEFQNAVRQLGLPFQFLPALPPSSRTHAVDFYLDQAARLGGRTVEPLPHIPCPKRRGDYAVIHPFSSNPRKNWPLERFHQVAAWLAPRLPVNWCAGPDEDLPAAHRFDDLYQLACWLANARLYLGNDSGISHLAAAVATPTVVLFGPSDPAVWAPRGPHVHVVAAPSPAAPVHDIPLPAVLNAVATALSHPLA